jgi:hypothetical protein
LSNVELAYRFLRFFFACFLIIASGIGVRAATRSLQSRAGTQL